MALRLTPQQLTALTERHRLRFYPRLRTNTALEGENARFEPLTQHSPNGFMPLGAYSYIRDFTPGITQIGRYCSIAPGLHTMGDSHPADWASTNPIFYQHRRFRMFTGAPQVDFDMPRFAAAPEPITIGHDVWIGENVSLKGGITIGNGAVLAYGAVVVSDVPPYAIVGGVPAKLIRYRFPEEIIAAMGEIGWYNHRVENVGPLPVDDPEAFIREFLRRSGDWEPLSLPRQTIGQYLSELDNIE